MGLFTPKKQVITDLTLEEFPELWAIRQNWLLHTGRITVRNANSPECRAFLGSRTERGEEVWVYAESCVKEMPRALMHQVQRRPDDENWVPSIYHSVPAWMRPRRIFLVEEAESEFSIVVFREKKRGQFYCLVMKELR